MGKTKFLEQMVREDILAGHGLCFIDPHGEVYKNILEWCSANGVDKFRRIHLIDATLSNWRTGFNPLQRYEGEQSLDRVDHMIEALAQVWGGEQSLDTPSIRTVLRALLTVLIENNHTLAEAFPLTRLTDTDAVRAFLTSEITSPIVQELWEGYKQTARKAPREFLIEFGGARRRLAELLHDDHVREMLGQIQCAIDFRKCMDDGDIVLVNLSENAMGDARARAIGALLIRELFLVAKRRDVEYAKTHPFYLYVDECADFLTDDIKKLLGQTRKFGLHAILAHQWLQQLRDASDAIYFGVMGIQSKVVFGGLQDPDAALIADELFRTEYDIEMPVEALIKPTVVRYVQTWLSHWSETATEGEVESEGDTSVEASSTMESQRFDVDGFPVGGITAGTGTGTAVTLSRSGASVSMRSRGEGQSEAYLPVLEDRPTAVHGLETIRHLAIARLRSIPKQQAIVKAIGLPSFDMTAFTIHEPVVHPQSLAAFTDRLMRASPYAIPASDAKRALAHRDTELKQNIETWKLPVYAEDDPDEHMM